MAPKRKPAAKKAVPAKKAAPTKTAAPAPAKKTAPVKKVTSSKKIAKKAKAATAKKPVAPAAAPAPAPVRHTHYFRNTPRAASNGSNSRLPFLTISSYFLPIFSGHCPHCSCCQDPQILRQEACFCQEV